jgi:hypothetical protein
MIISHEYKFIFIKTRKTAGSSIEKILLENLKGTDYIFGGMPPEKMDPINAPYCEHKGYKWISKNYPKEWDNYFTFAVERNPWDRLVSAYFWYKKIKPVKVKRGFEGFIKSNKLASYNDWQLYGDNNGIQISRLINYSSLNVELLSIDIPYNGELNSVFLKNDTREIQNYREMYNEECKDIVSREFKNQIKYFNYTF